MVDRYIDHLAQRIAKKAEQSGNEKVYNDHEKRSYANYVATAREAGKTPLTLEEIRAKRALKMHGKIAPPTRPRSSASARALERSIPKTRIPRDITNSIDGMLEGVM